MGRDGYVVPADPGAGAAMITASANVNLKKKNQSARSWILLDSRGEGTNLDVDKYAIMHRVHIHARDLRILDPLLSYPSTILGRDKAIVLNLEVTLLFFFFFFHCFRFVLMVFFFLVSISGCSAYQGNYHCWRGLSSLSLLSFFK